MGLQHLTVDNIGVTISKQTTNVVTVNVIADLPTASGGKITLLPSTKYLLAAPLNIGTNYLEMGNNTVLDSIGHDLTIITYTGIGAAIRGTNVSCVLREIAVYNAAQGFSFIGTGVEEIDIFQCEFENCTKIGVLDSLLLGLFSNNNLDGNTDGIEIKYTVTASPVGNYGVFNNKFVNTNTGSFIKSLSGNYNAINIASNNMDIPLGSIGIDFNEIGMTVVQKVVFMNNNLIGASTTKINGFNPLDGMIESVGNIGFKNNQPHPSVTTTEMFAITNFKVGMPLFNTTINELVYWDGVKWDKINSTQIFNEMLVNDFEAGIGSFVAVNNGINNWIVGTAAPSTGLKSLYISSDGINNIYVASGGGTIISHVYVDVILPAATTSIALQFDWKCEAEIGFDFGELHDVPTTTLPVVNVSLGATGKIGLANYNNNLGFSTEQINLPLGEAGTTRRFVWSFINDFSVQNQPPFNIDNVKIVYL